MRFQGKTAIVTGGGRGIGRAISLGYAAEGANVVVAARTAPEVEEVAREIEGSGARALPVQCDVTDERSVEALVGRTVAEFGDIAVLVNNAGIASARPVWGLSEELFQTILRVNLVGSLLCTKHVWRP